MKTTLKSAIALLVALPSLAFAATWDVDPAHSSAGFTVKHMMVSNVTGSFNIKQGAVNLDDKDITKSTVEATLDAATVNTGNAKRDEHLKAPDFFDTAKYPTITFKSTKVEKAGEGKLKVTGNLTMHGVTKPVVLDVTGPSKESKDPWGNTRTGVSATTKLNRKDFGLTYNTALETGGVAVGEEVTVNLDLSLTKKADAAAPAKK
ncbi:YceI family protein [Myxococcus sp. MISCRS1]|jgi:polyisoprenoid-binding protein YceI|uniref:YceI family protein n=1 Tax=Myxococcus TaxID=32 RepID=UPI001CC1074A|nr:MULTISPECIES: YceI family protein [unclassified Myxococcus]MBZ4394494.1 YceI family protein [Myxococcus sp. AS-1-15]MBZ4410589.1 YceI family protein [Myxococcus sp. XM-1-1-1]MCY1001464.1 YceI family protein [Myxococcus sp. MISCRS1]BDT36965.1 YceI family protein [Myxococcus sp. MH1]